jgi:hypothetical protein
MIVCAYNGVDMVGFYWRMVNTTQEHGWVGIYEQYTFKSLCMLAFTMLLGEACMRLQLTLLPSSMNSARATRFELL